MACVYKIRDFCDYLLESEQFADYCPNGLQVEGQREVKKVVTAVSASLELFERAQKESGELILVHHGILWGGDITVRGYYKQRLSFLLEHNISLLAYHLPLDAHTEVGNNAQVAQRLQLQNREAFAKYKGRHIGVIGDREPLTLPALHALCRSIFQDALVLYNFGPQEIRRIGIATGSAEAKIIEAAERGCDAFITGEVSEPIMHLAKELKIHFIGAGHYHTEKFGVQALGGVLSSKFELEHTFIDIPNTV